MEKLICLDSSIFIHHFREKDKENTFFSKLSYRYSGFNISIVAEFQVLIGVSNGKDENYWDTIFKDCTIIPFTSPINKIAINYSKKLRNSRQQLEFKDLVIGATAIHKHLPLANLNSKYFDKLDSLLIITPFSLV